LEGLCAAKDMRVLALYYSRYLSREVYHANIIFPCFKNEESENNVTMIIPCHQVMIMLFIAYRYKELN